MNERSQNFGFGLSWLIGTYTLVYVIPHTKIGPYLSQLFLGANPGTGRWIGYLLAHIGVIALLWAGMSFYHVVIRDGEEPEIIKGSASWMYGGILVLAAVLLLGPRLLFKISKVEWYLRLAVFLGLSLGMLWDWIGFSNESHRDTQGRKLFDQMSLGLAWSAVTALSITLLLSICSTGKPGTLRAFLYDLARGKEESTVLYAFIAVGLLCMLIYLGNRSIRAIVNKELWLYFSTPIAYAVMMLFTFLTGFFFYNLFATFDRAQMMYRLRARQVVLNLNDFVFTHTFRTFGVILLFLVPILTMRLLAEEKKNRTYELLMTAPITSAEIVISKYLSAFVVLASMLAVTFAYPLVVGWVSPGSFEWAPIFTGYFGLLLLVGTFAAIGLLCSSLSEDQIIAAAIAFGILMLLWVIEWAASFMSPGWGRETVQYLSILSHLKGFTKGLLSGKDIVYYVSFIFLSGFLTHRVVESQRWS